MRIGYIGLGNMGSPLASRVVSGGFALSVFDVRPDAVVPLEQLGAQRRSSPAALGADADVVGIVVRDDAEVKAVVCGPDGVLAAARPGTLVAVHSTISLDTLRTVAAAAEATGVRVIDAAVSGGADGARAGKLCVMVGGDEADFTAARPVLDTFGGFVLHLGPLGSGMAMKLARNLSGYLLMAAAHEGMALAERAGLPLASFKQVVEYTDALNPVFTLWLRRPTTAAFDRSTEADAVRWSEWGRGLADKDLEDALQLADEVGVDLPVARAAHAALSPIWRTPAGGPTTDEPPAG